MLAVKDQVDRAKTLFLQDGGAYGCDAKVGVFVFSVIFLVIQHFYMATIVK